MRRRSLMRIVLSPASISRLVLGFRNENRRALFFCGLLTASVHAQTFEVTESSIAQEQKAMTKAALHRKLSSRPISTASKPSIAAVPPQRLLTVNPTP